jgi:hypothetical protein
MPYKPWYPMRRARRFLVVIILVMMRLIWPYDTSIFPGQTTNELASSSALEITHAA